MVRTNQKTDFSFPFKKSTKEAVILTNNLDKTDRLLSSFALSFFMAILLLISLDSAKTTFHNNAITSNWNQQSMIPSLSVFAITDNSSKTKDIKQPIEKEVTPKVAVPLVVSKKEKEVFKTELKKKAVVKKMEYRNVAPPTIKNYSVTTSSSTFKRNPSQKAEMVKLNLPSKAKFSKRKNKSKVLVAKKLKTKSTQLSTDFVINELVVNKSITDDLLPSSYFEAKNKAASEGKLLFIKFGAKWCLPCRQMNKVTFKNKQVTDILEKEYINLAVDIDDFDGFNLKSYFNVKMLPTMLVFNANGKFLAKYSQFKSAHQMVKILESHSEQELESHISAVTINTAPKVLAPQITFNQIELKKTINGNAIDQLKAKAKNWRFTCINLGIQNIEEGILKINIIEKKSGKEFSTIEIPWTNQTNGIADTTTTNFQLDLPLIKRKKKEGEYVLEIFHIVQNSSKLIGKTTLAKDGQIILAN